VVSGTSSAAVGAAVVGGLAGGIVGSLAGNALGVFEIDIPSERGIILWFG